MEHSLRTSILFTAIAAVWLASTSLVYAIDPNASAVIQKANQQATTEAQNTQERITQMEHQIVRLHEELIALREEMQAQRELQATKELR